MFGWFRFSHVSPPLFSPLPEEPQTDIGLPREKLSGAKEIKERKRILRENRRNAEMERAARLRTGQCPSTSLPAPAAPGLQLLPLHPPSLLAVLIPLDDVRAEWERTSGPFHKQRVAEHCGVFRDLFKGATFTPWVALRVHYSQEDEHLVPVYYGNMVTPSEVREGSWEQPGAPGKPVSASCFQQAWLIPGSAFYQGISSVLKETILWM